jgi:GDPmannose 4,6-dehydratase
MASDYLDLDLVWIGEGVTEIGYSRALKKTVIQINPEYYRPAEVDTLLGDASKAKQRLGWEPTTSLENLVEEMVAYDLATS